MPMASPSLLRMALAGTLALLLAGVCTAEGGVGLTEDQETGVAEVLKESDAPMKLEDGSRIAVFNFLDAPYWREVMDLGRSISDEALGKLEADKTLSLENTLAVSAARCVRDEVELIRMIHTYTEMIPNGPRAKLERLPQAEDLTARHRSLEAVRLCEAEHPQILSLKPLGLDLHPTQRGVADQITEVVFLQKDAEGKWLWKDAIDKLPEKERTPAVTEVLRIAKELYRAS